MSKPKILLQLDSDAQPSTFDSVVAIDSGVDQLVTQCGVTAENVEGLVHGAMFTRGPADLKNTALFFGGSDVATTDSIVETAVNCFFGPMRVSFMSDPNGSNTTAAAAVLCAEKHLKLNGTTTTILAGTGPVGQRIAQIISKCVAKNPGSTSIRVCSRKLEKAQQVCQELKRKTGDDLFTPIETATAADADKAIEGAQLVFAAGAAGIELLGDQWQGRENTPIVAIDLNAVPPAGIAGIEVMDKAKERNQTICYGAIGVGGLKMKIHKRCIAQLFESNDQTLLVKEIYEIGKSLE